MNAGALSRGVALGRGFLVTRNPRVRLYPRSRLAVLPGGSVDVDGRLHLGPAWDGGIHYPSQLVVRAGGRLLVTGELRLMTGFRIWINEGAMLTFGSGYINNGLNLSCFQAITIGDDCAIAENVTIRDSDDHLLSRSRRTTAPVKIGDHVWVGLGATILKGITVGDGAVVAAGAVVVKDVPSRTLVGGVPARLLRLDVDWS